MPALIEVSESEKTISNPPEKRKRFCSEMPLRRLQPGEPPNTLPLVEEERGQEKWFRPLAC